MLKDKLTPEQENIFFRIYNNVLHAEISNTKEPKPTTSDIRLAMYDAANIALNTLDIIYEEDGTMNPLSHIIDFFDNKRLDDLFEFPKLDK